MRYRWIGVVALMSAIVAGCSTLQWNLPAVAPAVAERLPGKVVWHDLVTEDPDAAKQFYSAAFGWEFNAVAGLKYWVISHEGQPVGGMVDAREFTRAGNVSQWVVVLSVANIEGSIEALKAGGGSLMGGPVDVGDRGQLALVRDEQGAYFAVLQTRDGDPPDEEIGVGTFMWDELWTSESRAARKLYRTVFGYDARQVVLDSGERFSYLASENTPRVAVLDMPVPGMAPTWVSYIRVEDVGAMTAEVAQLGGEVLLPPQENPVGGELAILKDPVGAGFIIQTWDRARLEAKP